MAEIHVRFYAELGDFLPAHRRGREFAVSVASGTSVKDLVEGLGAPHTEVDLVLANGEPVGFDYLVRPGDRISVYPVFESLDITGVTRVRPQPLREPRFVADVHLGRLTRYLRLVGFDTLYRNDWTDRELVEAAQKEHRIILTRDRGLLMRRQVTHGYLVRSAEPREQLEEVVLRFDLGANLCPFTRCSKCNGLVEQVAKAEVASQLPPRTALQVEEFWRCTGCGQLYWQGAHHRSLRSLLERLSRIGLAV